MPSKEEGKHLEPIPLEAGSRKAESGAYRRQVLELLRKKAFYAFERRREASRADTARS